MKYSFLFLTLAILTASTVHAQSNADTLLHYAGWKPQNQSSLILISVNERMRVSPDVLHSGKGLGFEGGINPGYFFNQRLLLGFFAGWAMQDGMYSTTFTNSYRNDFNQSLNTTGLHGNDSLVVDKLSSLVNGGGLHDQEYYYGLIFRLPYRRAPVVKLYTGQMNWRYRTFDHLQVYTANASQEYDHDYYKVTHSLRWGAEVSLFDGYSEVYEYENIHPKNKRYFARVNILFLSFFLQRINSGQSVYSFDNGVVKINFPASSLLRPAFVQKYKANFYYGFRLSFGLF